MIMDLRQKINVMQAFLDGKPVEVQGLHSDVWTDIDDPVWNWDLCDYRIKQEEVCGWVNVYCDGPSTLLHRSFAEANLGAYHKPRIAVVKLVQAERIELK